MTIVTPGRYKFFTRLFAHSHEIVGIGGTLWAERLVLFAVGITVLIIFLIFLQEYFGIEA